MLSKKQFSNYINYKKIANSSYKSISQLNIKEVIEKIKLAMKQPNKQSYLNYVK